MFVPCFDAKIDAAYCAEKNELIITVSAVNVKTYTFSFETEQNTEANQKDLLVFCKIALYRALSDYFGVNLPWGSLTGIRPTKIVYKLLAQGKTLDSAINVLKNKYLVAPDKAALIGHIIENQRGLIYHAPEFVNLYVHIPFCPTKCGYCSFVTLAAEKYNKLIDPYLDCLIKEIRQTKDLIAAQNKKILSVYIGGGTPTVLNEKQLERLLFALDTGTASIEYTLEAGRPDTINAEKLQVLKRNGVTRICINPQTFQEKTLQRIGRKHSVQEIFNAFEWADKFNFDINTDLIAGLPDETAADFSHTLDTAIRLSPANITVHSLSFKNGSQLSNAFINDKTRPQFGYNRDTPAMVELAHSRLKSANYVPYYLYRQKNMSGNLENTGYCLRGKQSVNNITVMEESVSVYACGAGAISKKITGDRIERYANLRDVALYIKEIDERSAIKKTYLS